MLGVAYKMQGLLHRPLWGWGCAGLECHYTGTLIMYLLYLAENSLSLLKSRVVELE